jgi:hypothetical protein
MLASDIINQAFVDLTVITVNETISTAMQTDAFMRLNELLDSLSAEGLTVPNQLLQAFNLVANTQGYTLGSGGTFATTGALRAMKVTAWRAYYQTLLQSGGRVLSLAEFGEQAKQLMGEQTPIPSIVGADTAYPLINVRVFPPPGFIVGVLELAYTTPLTQFVTVGDTVSLPQGWNDILHFCLAQRLYPQYPKPSQRDTIWDMAQRSKAALSVENAMTAPQPQAAAPQGQR